MNRPLLEGGALAVVNGRISAVGPAAEVRRLYPSAPVTDLGDSLLLPGLVNAHVHLELSDLIRREYPGSFVGWIQDLLSRTPMQKPREMNHRIEQAVEMGTKQSLRFGVTTLGDISANCRTTRAVLRRLPARAVSFGEVRAMGKRRGLLEQRLSDAAERIEPAEAPDHLRAGISPHAPYSIERSGYERCLAVAREQKLPLATHLAETPDEATFLAEHAGPFRALWETLGAWDEAVPYFVGGPVEFARSVGLLDYPAALLAHVNYCNDHEMDLLAAGCASVVYCPRTHAYFQHPPHRWREMLASGINVAIGTDSRASAPDLNLVDDLRLLRLLAPNVPASLLWEMATTRAAQAIGMEAAVGSLWIGKWADCVAFPVHGRDPLGEVLDSPVVPSQVWIGGRSVRIE